MTIIHAALGLGLVLDAARVCAGAAQPSHRWHFIALLDGKPIGEHDFVVERRGDETVVDSAARFRVRVALIPLYHYDHHDREVWRNGCLTSVASQTDDNGRKDFLTGALQGARFALESSRGAAALPACVRTFAYWDPNLLTDPRLLNTQTGQYQAVTLTANGVHGVGEGDSTSLRRYALRGPHLATDLWYSAAGEWVALESKLESGRTLRYELQ
jgi:hypothetical protein